MARHALPREPRAPLMSPGGRRPVRRAPEVPRRIAPDDRVWLGESGLVDSGVELAAVRLHCGGPVSWYLRWRRRGALTLGKHVWFARGDRSGDRALLAHELVHVGQYQELGVLRFFVRYLRDLARARFRYSARLPLEAPAYARGREARTRLDASRPDA
ncbi:MAG: DUF4157 domain-containing protein [Dehalococcoidia bacterium]|nr:DUF4157 domain-containing protein [Dehalococcoidia bacterium]